MAFEVTCGECSGELLIEAAGVIVECPLCGAHLSIPESAGDPAPHTPAGHVVAETTTADSQIVATAVGAAHCIPQAAAPTEPAVSADAESSINHDGNGHVATAAEGEHEWVSHSQPNLGQLMSVAAGSTQSDELPANLDAQQMSEEPTQVLTKQAAIDMQTAPVMPSIADVGGPQPALTDCMAATAATASPPAPQTTAGREPEAAEPVPAPEETVPRQYFILVAGYASAVTLALLYLLLFGMGNSKRHALESLPDLVPEIRKDGAVGMPRVLPKMDVADGHVLKLGESQRYGNLQVTPIKVTRGPIQFVHAYGNARAKKDPSGPVLKLWLKFENVSKDQEFPPLDRALVFRRIFDPKLGSEFSLNFLCPEDQRVPKAGERHFVYDMPEFSEFNLEGQHLEHWLKPGETMETYIPSVEGITDFNGEWVWRVLFRKGLNRESGRGVTTLIDVKFDGEDVLADS